MVQVDRIVPVVPPKGEKLRLLIDTDFANEIDDLYAVALALLYPERFALEGLVAANYNNGMPGAGPASVEASYNLLNDFLAAGGLAGKVPVLRGAQPMQYLGFPADAEGVDFIIERAHAGSVDNPLWVVGLGVATDLASALLKDPTIRDKVRYVYHARSDHYWPERSRQFNVKGDIHAAREILRNWVPLVWFDTGTHLSCSVELTDTYLASTGGMGKFLHDYRFHHHHWQTLTKGFFDMGDIVYLYDPAMCCTEIVKAPTMDEYMFFNHEYTNGKMVRVFDIDNNASWNLLFDGFAKNYKSIGGK